jgi:hypothetical protein
MQATLGNLVSGRLIKTPCRPLGGCIPIVMRFVRRLLSRHADARLPAGARRICGDDAVSPGDLGLIKCHISAREKTIDRVTGFPCADAKAAGHAEVRASAAPRPKGWSVKRAAVAMMVPGVKVSALARELGVCRQRLYDWREAMQAGDEQLRRRGDRSGRDGLSTSSCCFCDALKSIMGTPFRRDNDALLRSGPI